MGFMPADSLWTLAMACNVYLTFFRKYNAAQLKKLEWKYFLACYGIPFPPAVTYLFVESKARGKVYGPATLWCWITPGWDALRVATFYGPVWQEHSLSRTLPYPALILHRVVVMFTVFIYVLAGVEIYQKRRQLRKFQHPGPLEIVENPFVSTKTTKIEVTSEPAGSRNQSEASLKQAHEGIRVLPSRAYMEYSITIESGANAPKSPRIERPRTALDANTAAWGYTRIAFLFFLALLITWVPSSVNRVYSLVHPEKANFPLNFVASLVLPLQGFWNGLIYFMTSLSASRKLGRRLSNRIREIVRPGSTPRPDSSDDRSVDINLQSRHRKAAHYESDSQRSLACSPDVQGRRDAEFNESPRSFSGGYLSV
ncbi:hypothetical protein FGG08_001254 [Glutinoglossum americanum]|uniref:G-protein coupled receptors family 2 profile 2 domain-containing protein n=1 Tax=Glutinoglossum americanum TaxID=1670608 RepID=A0A9P8L5F6_9PEZI|nr:hypothetical protein FGG08_001254 [Glutinoglossum americanum]